MLAAQQCQLNHQQVVIGGGMESMSQVPFYLTRGELPYGGSQLIDGIVKDGLTDAYDRCHMGNCGEKTAKEMKISRDAQDDYAIGSYKRSAAAWKVNLLYSKRVHYEELLKPTINLEWRYGTRNCSSYCPIKEKDSHR